MAKKSDAYTANIKQAQTLHFEALATALDLPAEETLEAWEKYADYYHDHPDRRPVGNITSGEVLRIGMASADRADLAALVVNTIELNRQMSDAAARSEPVNFTLRSKLEENLQSIRQEAEYREADGEYLARVLKEANILMTSPHKALSDDDLDRIINNAPKNRQGR